MQIYGYGCDMNLDPLKLKKNIWLCFHTLSSRWLTNHSKSSFKKQVETWKDYGEKEKVPAKMMGTTKFIKITLLPVIPIVTNYFIVVSDIASGSI